MDSFSDCAVVLYSAKMWGAGAGQGGIIQTSSGKLDLKEPYYRMSQPQAYSWAQDQQPNLPVNSQVGIPSSYVLVDQNNIFLYLFL